VDATRILSSCSDLNDIDPGTKALAGSDPPGIPNDRILSLTPEAAPASELMNNITVNTKRKKMGDNIETLAISRRIPILLMCSLGEFNYTIQRVKVKVFHDSQNYAKTN
jgi:hypothetical protein